MYNYIARRLAYGLLTVFGVSVVVFVVMRVLPGDPLVALFGPEGFQKLSADERAHFMADLGLCDPLIVQYLPAGVYKLAARAASGAVILPEANCSDARVTSRPRA